MKSLPSTAIAILLFLGTAMPLPAQTDDRGSISPTASQAWLTSMDALYAGPAVEKREDLKAYTGSAAADRIIGEDRKIAYLRNYKQLGINYGEAVDFQLRRQQTILCPETVRFLYSEFTPTDVKFQPGTRPVLEKVVAKATANAKSQREKALALMRFCRDLYKQDPDADFAKYIYGGTEEQLVDKPEILCECLGRLMVALCEIAGLPGRIVMHDIGGHICCEILSDGHWAYIDPRCGIYFLKPDGEIASVLELCQDPSIIRTQPDRVKADVSDQWTWHYRAWKCENMYFHPKEVNGFENYSLSETEKYSYLQLPRQQVLAAGLMDVNKEYVAAARRVFGLTEDGTQHTWGTRKLRRLPIAYRHDGFSPFFVKPPLTRKDVERRLIDPFEGTNVEILVWGLGPGSVFCFDTKVGQIFGEGLTEEQRAMVRQGDLWVHQNVTNLIRQGTGPLRIAVERGRELDLPVFARLEMNHEYGPADLKNWQWVAFVGDFNKKHPEYRIDGTVFLDFKHKEVRDFKLAIFREAAEAGADGIALDFAVYPPYFTKPDPAIMTQFLRDVRAMLDEVGKTQNRRIQIMARVANVDYMALGLDWKTWMRERLVDVIVPTKRHQRDHFELCIEEFVSLASQTGVRVIPSIWHALGFVDTDPHPTRKARYDKPKTKGMFYAQALLLHRAGADGIQLAQSSDGWRSRPWFNDLAEPERILFADKHYMVDPVAMRRCRFKESGSRTVGLRIGDDVAAAGRASRNVKATLVVYCRPLKPGENLAMRVNGSEPVTISGNSDDERARIGEKAVKGNKQFYQRDWWKRGEHKLETASDCWKLGHNEIKLGYSNDSAEDASPLSVTWIDLLLDYDEK